MVNDLSLSFPKTDFFAAFSPSEIAEHARRLRVYTRLRGPHVRGPLSPDGPGGVPRPPGPVSQSGRARSGRGPASPNGRPLGRGAPARGPEPDSQTEPAPRPEQRGVEAGINTKHQLFFTISRFLQKLDKTPKFFKKIFL